MNVTPPITIGGRLAPVRRRHPVEAARMGLRIIGFARGCDSAPPMRPVRCPAVATTLSIGVAVRR